MKEKNFHDQFSIECAVSSTGDPICREKWRDKGSGSVPCKPQQHLPLEEALHEAGISYTRIRIATPRHNGKVERQHRTDEKRFYKKLRMYNRFSNTIPKVCLDYRSPKEVYRAYMEGQSGSERI